MIKHLWLPTALALGSLVFVGCAPDPTEPSILSEQPGTTAAAAVSASDTWLTRATMPIADRSDYVVGTVTNAAGQSVVYAIGGRRMYPTFPPLGRVQGYNVTTNKWTWGKDMPTALTFQNGAGVIGKKIYVSGGFASSWWRAQPTAYLYVYNTATNTWARKRDMPAAGANGVTGVINGKLYVVTETTAGVAFFRYDPAVDLWVTLPKPAHVAGQIPIRDQWSRLGGVLSNKLYLVGTYELDDLQVYDPATNRWTMKAPPPPGLDVSGVAMWAKLYLFGAQSTPGTAKPFRFVTLAYDVASNTWTERTPPPFYLVGSATRVSLNGQWRVEVLDGYRNMQYIP